jgi:hypothetical protein
MEPSMIAEALRSVRVDRFEGNGATYVTLEAPHAPGQGRVTFTIKLLKPKEVEDVPQLDYVTASVRTNDGREKFCGFMAPVLEEPMCPVYRHI